MDKSSSSPSGNDQILVNVIEEFVKLQAKQTIDALGGCKCNTCYLNTCALALNELDSKYVTTTKGELISQITAMEIKNQAEIVVSVTKAAMKVIKNPHHGSTTAK